MKVTLKRKAFQRLSNLAFVVAPIVFSFSFLFSEKYLNGDQIFYHRFYDALRSAPILNVPILQFSFTGSGEPLYGLLSWTGAQISPKNIWMSIFNTLLVVTLIGTIQKLRVSLLIYPLVLTNYYLFVVMFSAERLKFAILCILFAVLFSGRSRLVFAGLSVLFHFQSLLFLSSMFGAFFSRILRQAMRGRLNIVALATLSLSVVAVFVLWYFYGLVIIQKVSNYSGEGLIELSKFLILFMIGMFVAKEKFAAFCAYIPLGIATLILGGDRINMVTFFFTIYYTYSWNRGLNPITISILGYFSLRGLAFLSNVLSYGTGYPGDFS